MALAVGTKYHRESENMSRSKNDKGLEIAAAPVAYLHRDLSTQNQVHILLSITGSLLPVLMRYEDTDGSIPGKPISTDGGVYMAAESTFVKACGRLDDIMSDESRWTPEFQLALEKQLGESHKASMETYAAQLSAAKAQLEASKAHKSSVELITTPHFLYHPKLVQLTDGTYAAFLGDIETPEFGLIGIGRSPGEALRRFDDVFNGVPMDDEFKTYLQQKLKKLNENKQALETLGTEDGLGHEGDEPSDALGADSEGPGPE